MNRDEQSQDSRRELRRRAEERLQAIGFLQGNTLSPGKLAEEERLQLIHELQVHQIELEMQNEALFQAQLELAAARDRYFALFDLAPVGYFLLDEEAVILEANLAGAELLGLKRNELHGKKLTSFIHEQDQDIFYLLKRQVYRSHTQADGELRFVKSGGNLFHADVTCVQINEPGDQDGQLRLILRDVTEFKANERSLKSYAARLEVLNRDLESFTSVASHDLQAPLRKIISFGKMVKSHLSTEVDEEVLDLINRMQSAAVRMQSLISGLLAYSRIPNDVLSFKKVDLNEIVLEVLEDLDIVIKGSHAQVEMDDLPIFFAEPTLMRQLFQNLIENALKFHQPEKTPVIQIESSRCSPQMVEIRVSDQGIGFDVQYLEKIFQPFERLHGNDQFAGTGIGLAICRKIVERHSGSITARSEPGKGTTFIVNLPVQQG